MVSARAKCRCELTSVGTTVAVVVRLGSHCVVRAAVRSTVGVVGHGALSMVSMGSVGPVVSVMWWYGAISMVGHGSHSMVVTVVRGHGAVSMIVGSTQWGSCLICA